MIWIRIIAAGFLLLFVAGIVKSTVEASSASATFLYTVAKVYPPLAWMHGADRFPEGANIFIHESAGQRPLMPEFASTADPAISFDGERVLFAGKRNRDDPWQIFEVSLGGGDARQITSGKDNCVRPFYLPEGRLVYAHKAEGRFHIEAADLLAAMLWS